MAWYWWAPLLGAIYPWTIAKYRLDILHGFRNFGPQQGFGAWFGMSLVAMPIFLLLVGAIHWIFG